MNDLKLERIVRNIIEEALGHDNTVWRQNRIDKASDYIMNLIKKEVKNAKR